MSHLNQSKAPHRLRYFPVEMEVEEILKDLSLTVKSDNLQLKAMGIPLSNSLQLLQCHPTPRKCLQDSHLDSSHQGHGLLHLLHQQALQ